MGSWKTIKQTWNKYDLTYFKTQSIQVCYISRSWFLFFFFFSFSVFLSIFVYEKVLVSTRQGQFLSQLIGKKLQCWEEICRTDQNLSWKCSFHFGGSKLFSLAYILRNKLHFIVHFLLNTLHYGDEFDDLHLLQWRLKIKRTIFIKPLKTIWLMEVFQEHKLTGSPYPLIKWLMSLMDLSVTWIYIW